MRLTAAQKRFYDENGFLAVEGVVSPEQVAAMRQRIEELCARWDSEEVRRLGVQQEADITGTAAAVKTPETVRKFAGLVAHEPVFRAHAANPGLLDLVEDLIG